MNKNLKKRCQRGVIGGNSFIKTPLEDYPHWFARKFSILITSLLIKTKFTPNQISIFSIFVGIFGALLFFYGSYKSFMFGAFFLFLWFVLDHVDGEVARYKNEKSVLGHYLDKMMHSIIHPLVFLSIGLGLFNRFGNINWIFLGIISSFSIFLIDLVRLNKLETRLYKHLSNNKESSTLKKFKLNFLYQFQWVLFIMIILTILDLLQYFLIFYSFVLFLKFVISFFNTINNEENWR